jgi:hypothetical protein
MTTRLLPGVVAAKLQTPRLTVNMLQLDRHGEPVVLVPGNV